MGSVGYGMSRTGCRSKFGGELAADEQRRRVHWPSRGSNAQRLGFFERALVTCYGNLSSWLPPRRLPHEKALRSEAQLAFCDCQIGTELERNLRFVSIALYHRRTLASDGFHRARSFFSIHSFAGGTHSYERHCIQSFEADARINAH